MTTDKHCPCGSEETYEACCGRFHHQGAYPQSAETLMRSRYSAYVKVLPDYLKKTWHPGTYPTLARDDLENTEWLRLNVLEVQSGLKKAIVEFKAYYKEGDTERCLHERSNFKKLKNRWVYVDGNHSST